MTVSDCLDTLRAEIPGCQVAAFGDAKARLILKASHDATVQREVLDGLCADAARCFTMAQSLADHTGGSAHNITLTDREMRIYLRANGREDFLCLLCPLESDPIQLLPIGFQALAQLVEIE
ncbi:hypothetical protein [Shimia sagamensis]|uniref:Roadblock/LAMTOR2 domain-containing protein n=1 Tax=Shimia sagamensis TaxID=1566352 RepID=A0ABY1PBU7_9RHOB|nr:hypothetical protein [Shimia sagamensis]SMP31030.1 hypothetical protein SAMN06265373_107189 [Shimia sagamensis]